MDIINIGILAHVDAGKTTLTEGLLVHSGVKRQAGRVDSGTTTTDSMPLEQQRGLTIRASTVSFEWNGVKINLIDTPGHMDFIAEVERSLSVLDGVVLVVSAREGVQQQTRVLFQKLQQMRIPTLFFINKIDRVGASAENAMRDICCRLTPHLLPLQDMELWPLSLAEGPLHESVIELDEGLLARYIEGDVIPESRCRHLLAERTRACTVYPMLMGSALKDIGVVPVLDAVTWLFHGGGDTCAPLSARAYKVEWDQRGRKRHTVRVFSGVLRVREYVGVSGQDEAMQIKGLLAAKDGKFIPADHLSAGDIGQILDAPALRVGDFLGEERSFSAHTDTPPLLSVTVSPASPEERQPLLSALSRLVEEDPALQLHIAPETGEITLRLYGPLQQEIVSALLMERFSLRAVFAAPRPILLARPDSTCQAEIRMRNRGNLHAAGIALSLEPLPPGTGNQFETIVSFGDLEKSFQTAVTDGVMSGLREGLGHAITDTRVVFTDMDYDSVGSTPADFRRLAPEVLKLALKSASLTLLEPWLAYQATVPQENVGRVIQALVKATASPEAVEPRGEEVEMFGAIQLERARAINLELPGLTQGRGVFVTSFSGYRPVGNQYRST